MKKILMLCFAVFCLLFCVPRARAAQAEDISGKSLVTDHAGFSSANMLFDGRTIETMKIRNGGHITLEHEAGIGSLYLVFGTEYGSFSVSDGETACTFGENGFLHEFADLEAVFGYAPEKVEISFSNGDALLSEVSVFTSGQVPDWVQRWERPLEGEADLVLFSTHGDDEQLFFAGMLPWYSRELGCNVQVVYMTGHRNMSVRRSHEMLDGLWAVGIRHYPVFGPFGDYNSSSAAETYQTYRNKGITREDILSFVVENVRRFRPKVAVGHDLKGEYGHGMHMVYAELLCQAVEVAGDAEQFPESAEMYGIWDVPKTYLHLYPEHEIVMNWDIPMESFDGMTAYEVTKDLGFPCHISQQTYYSWYFSGKETAAEITEYSPCEFGLYRSTVGEDVQKNDFFENVTTHAEDARQEEETAPTEAVPEETQAPATQTVPAPEVLPEEQTEKVSIFEKIADFLWEILRLLGRNQG